MATRQCCWYLFRERWPRWRGGQRKLSRRMNKRCKLSEGRMTRWRRSWWREDRPLNRPMWSAGPSPPLPTWDRWRRRETRFSPTRWRENPFSTGRPGRPSPWTRPADIHSPTLSLKSHYQTSGRVSTETDVTGLPTRTSILMHIPPICILMHIPPICILISATSTVDGPPSISFFFISSFSLRRACISCSFFWTTSSVLLFISVISLWRDISNIAWSASVILSMLLVETIYFLSSASLSRSHGGGQLFLLGRWDVKNYWSLRFSPSVGQVARYLVVILLAFVSLLRLSVSGECQMEEVPAEDTPTLKSVKRVIDTRVGAQ